MKLTAYPTISKNVLREGGSGKRLYYKKTIVDPDRASVELMHIIYNLGLPALERLLDGIEVKQGDS